MSRPRFSLMAACALALAACGGGSGPATEGAAPAAEEVAVVFENTQFEDATLYVEGTGGRRRLGTIVGSNTERFRMDYAPTGYVFVAWFTALGELETDVITADPGETITITVQPTGYLSFTVR